MKNVRTSAGAKSAQVRVRPAKTAHAPRLHALISANLEEGRLLPRALDELRTHAGRFVIALKGRRIVGCAELAPLGGGVAEVRSLVVDPEARGLGVGSLLISELGRRGREAGFDRLCAFTHCPGYFMQFGFSIVPHVWVREKIATDCVNCAQFRQCGQYAMVASLNELDEIEIGDAAAEAPVIQAIPVMIARSA